MMHWALLLSANTLPFAFTGPCSAKKGKFNGDSGSKAAVWLQQGRGWEDDQIGSLINIVDL